MEATKIAKVVIQIKPHTSGKCTGVPVLPRLQCGIGVDFDPR